MGIRKLLAQAMVFGLIVCAISMGSDLVAFVDLPSVTLVLGITTGGILFSHTAGEILGAFWTACGTGQLSKEKASQAGAVFSRMSHLALASGLLGTLIGLIQMLQQMDDLTKIGPAMAVALLCPFYAIILSELIFKAAEADCRARSMNDTGSGSSGPPSVRKLIATVAIIGAVCGGITMGGSLVIFVNPISAELLLGVVLLGIFASHPPRKVIAALRSVFDSKDLDKDLALQHYSVLHRMAEIAIGIGLTFTLLGLNQMLQKLDDPTVIGPALSVALLTTFYGIVLSELFLRNAASDILRRAAVPVGDLPASYGRGRLAFPFVALLSALLCFFILINAMTPTVEIDLHLGWNSIVAMGTL
jgi:flagellar motor component MotA